MLASHRRRKAALPCTIGSSVEVAPSPLPSTLPCFAPTGLPWSPIYLHSYNRLAEHLLYTGSHARHGPCRWRRSRPSRSYHFWNHSFNHRAENSKRRVLSDILLWAEKNFSSPGPRKVNSCPHQKSPPRSGTQISQRQRVWRGGTPGVSTDRKLKDTTPASHARAMKWCPCHPSIPSGSTVGVSTLFIFLKERGDGGGGLEHKLLLSISIMFNVCKALLPSLRPELPWIIKKLENPAKNSKYLADRSTYHCVWQCTHH